MSQWQTFLRVLPTRWRRKPSGTENTSLSPYIEIEILIPQQHHRYSVLAAGASRRKADTMQCVRASCIRARLACDSAVPDRLLVYFTAACTSSRYRHRASSVSSHLDSVLTKRVLGNLLLLLLLLNDGFTMP